MRVPEKNGEHPVFLKRKATVEHAKMSDGHRGRDQHGARAKTFHKNLVRFFWHFTSDVVLFDRRTFDRKEFSFILGMDAESRT